MKQVFTLLLLSVWLVDTPVFAQKKSAKVYIADISVGNEINPAQTKRRNDEIKFQAKSQINNLLELLKLLTSNDLTESERNSVIKNSYLPNSNQIFYGDGVVVEDDIDPKHTSPDNSADLVVERYLRDMDLFYSKADTATITFSQIVTSSVVEGKDYIYVKVFFTSTFTGKHSQFDTSYQPVQRVAELRAERVEGKWRAFITRLAFLQPGEALTQLSKPVISKEVSPKRPIDGKPINFRRVDNPADSVTVKWDSRWLNITGSSTDMVPIGFYQFRSTGISNQNNVSIMLTKKDQQLTFRRIDGTTIGFKQISIGNSINLEKIKRQYRRKGWGQITTGVLALGASYAAYNSIRSDYNAYTGKLTALNSEYAIWQTLTQQPGANPTIPLSFSSYASPGIYAVYGGTIVGGGLIINGIRYLLKAGKIKTNSTK